MENKKEIPKKKEIPHISTIMRPRWIKKERRFGEGARIVFKNNGIKFRSADQMSEKEIDFYQNKRYGIFSVHGVKIIAISPKRALQTYARLQHI